LGLSGINFPLIASEKNTPPPPTLPFVLHFTSTQSITLPLLSLTVRRTPVYLLLCIAVLYSLFQAVSVLDFTVIVAVTRFSCGYSNESCLSVGPHSCLGIASALYPQPCTVSLTSTLVIAFPPRPRSQPIVTAVCHRVKSISQALSFPTTYLPPTLSTQHLSNTDIL
jgi:hypothetical protein